jgi:hypothetical protein
MRAGPHGYAVFSGLPKLRVASSSLIARSGSKPRKPARNAGFLLLGDPLLRPSFTFLRKIAVASGVGTATLLVPGLSTPETAGRPRLATRRPSGPRLRSRRRFATQRRA